MNPLHYPSLELCKKLTEIGFPSTVYSNGSWWIDSITYEKYSENWKDKTYRTVCPSVMEMLDVMPESIPDWRNRSFSIWTINMWKFGWFWAVQYGEWLEEWQTAHYIESKESLPNALAEMILWLVDNKYLTFPKNAK